MSIRSAPLNETPHTVKGPLMADRFRCGISYQTWRPRGTSDWLLILTVDGSGRVGSSATSFSTSPGDVVLYEPNTPQSYQTEPAAGHWHLLWAHFYPRPHWKEWLKWPRCERGLRTASIVDPGVQGEVRRALQDCVRMNRQNLSGAPDLALNALERSLLWIHSVARSTGLDERIRQAADILAEEINRPLSLAGLAQRCGLSLSRFAHLFRDEMGVSPQQYLENIRMERAAQMLRSTSLSIGEIAVESGYPNTFYFSTRFRKVFNQSPSSYRTASEKTLLKTD